MTRGSHDQRHFKWLDPPADLCAAKPRRGVAADVHSLLPFTLSPIRTTPPHTRHRDGVFPVIVPAGNAQVSGHSSY